MLPTRGYGIKDPSSTFEPFNFERREPGPHDVLIEILYCGICHSDIHQARNEWGGSIFPMVPGHEIVGQVTDIGTQVKRFEVGDLAGVGCFVDSCRVCENCKTGQEQHCTGHLVATYNGTEKDHKTVTYGGYSNQIVVHENYTMKISRELPLANVAPLLCAGITTYSPLRRFNVGPQRRVGVVGLGGLGHMAVKFAASFGAEVTVFSTSSTKEQDARRFGAQDFVITKGSHELANMAARFDLIIDAVSASHDVNMYLDLLSRTGALILVGASATPFQVRALSLITNSRCLAGSNIGGITETQEMLDYCAENNITSDIEVIPIQQVHSAYERVIKGDVRYRFVIDLKSL